MDWSKFKLGVGPMSKEVVNACLNYSKQHNFPLMIIGSRNQVDFNSGYAFYTQELVEFIKTNPYYDKNLIKICRDHCGPYFADNDKNLSYKEIVELCKLTIKEDLSKNFDLLHIDVSRVDSKKQPELAKQLIEFALNINPNIAIEFGSEDNTGNNLYDTLYMLNKQIDLVQPYKENIKFLVNQTGSLTKHTQIGIFNEELTQTLSEKIHQAGFLFKEHNADYLQAEQVKIHKKSGIDAINIAPQLGYTHTYVLSKLGYNYPNELKNYKQYVIEKNLWRKWIVDSVRDDETKFLVSAHYFLNCEYSKLITEIIDKKKLPFNELLCDEISVVLDQYRLGYGD